MFCNTAPHKRWLIHLEEDAAAEIVEDEEDLVEDVAVIEEVVEDSREVVAEVSFISPRYPDFQAIGTPGVAGIPSAHAHGIETNVADRRVRRSR